MDLALFETNELLEILQLIINEKTLKSIIMIDYLFVCISCNINLCSFMYLSNRFSFICSPERA